MTPAEKPNTDSLDQKPERILIVRPSALGDVCRTVPALVSLRAAYPNARIDWVVQDTFADAVAEHPALSNTVPFPRKRFGMWWKSPTIAREMIKWFLNLRKTKYDLVFDLQGLGRSGLITRITSAPVRVGYRSAAEGSWLGYTIKHDTSAHLHVVDKMLALIQAEGIVAVFDMGLYTQQSASSWWDKQRKAHDIAENRYAVLAPTSRWDSKRWPAEYWSELIEPLTSHGIKHCVLIGAPGEDNQICDSLRNSNDPSIINLSGKTSIAQTMAIISKSRLVIANDSAPLHMAVGFDRPLIGLFGPTEPSFVGPYKRDKSVIRIYDPAKDGRVNFRSRELGDSLMRLITPQMIVDRLDSILKKGMSCNSDDIHSETAMTDSNKEPKDVAISTGNPKE